MRRLLRFTLNAVTALSVLLALGLAGLWVRSYWVWDDAYIMRPPGYTARRALPYVSDLHSSGGGLKVGVLWPELPVPAAELARIDRDFPAFRYERVAAPPVYPQVSLGHLGRPWRLLEVDAEAYPSTTEFAAYACYRVVFPYALPVIALAALPAARLYRRARRRRRARAGTCAACGYDLRATPERCPECGTPARAG